MFWDIGKGFVFFCVFGVGIGVRKAYFQSVSAYVVGVIGINFTTKRADFFAVKWRPISRRSRQPLDKILYIIIKRSDVYIQVFKLE